MIQIAQSVDHRQAGPARQFVNGFLGEGARDDRVRPARQIARDIVQRFTIGDHADLGDTIAAKLLDGELKCHARAQGRLLKQQRNVAALESRGVALPRLLNLLREIKKTAKLLAREIKIMTKVQNPWVRQD